MDRTQKLTLSCSAIASAIFIIGVRIQQFSLLAIGFILLIILSLRYHSHIALFGLVTGFILLYPSPQMGWLYGRDSHRAAFGALSIIRNGWTTQSIAFAQTPLIHIHTAIVSIITNFPIYPSTEPRPLITSYLPIIYLISTFLFITSMISRFKEEVADLTWAVYLFPVIFWIPLVKFHSGFRRQSMAILFFAAAIYLLYNSYRTRRWACVFFVFAVATVIAHHLTIALLLIFGTILLTINKTRGVRNNTGILLLITVVFFCFWYIVEGLGGEIIFGVFVGIGTETADPELTNVVEPSLFNFYQSFLSHWLYQFIIGLCIFLGILYNDSNENTSYHTQAFLFGLFVGLISVGSFVIGLSVDYNRILSFFIISCGWIAPAGLYFFSKNYFEDAAPILLRIATILVVIIGVSMIPIHVVSSQPPDYTGGESTQRFEKLSYPAVEFVGGYMSKDRYMATLNLWGMISVETSEQVRSEPTSLINGSVQNESALVFTNWNKHLYTTKIANINPNMNDVNKQNEKVYSNGRVYVYIPTV